MKNPFILVLLACVLILGCMSIGCGAASQTAANAGQSSNPANPTNPANDPSGTLQIATMQLPDGVSNAPYAAQLAATGGTAPYVWSASGTLPAGLTMSSTGAISGTPSTTGQTMITVEVQDSEASPQTAQQTLALDVANGTSSNAVETSTPPTTAFSLFYGAGRGADGLGNTTVGPNGNTVSYRFVAQHSAALSKIRIYLIPDHTGYASGTAGKLQINVETDDGTSAHNPSGQVLSTAEISNPLAPSGTARYFPLVTFAVPPSLSAGKIYHIVFRNVDSSPTINYLSVDDLWYSKATSPVQPTVSDMASAVLLRSVSVGSSWASRKGYSPIMELYFSNGDYQGYGYIEAFVMAPEIISGSHQVREMLTVTGANRTISTVGMRLARLSGSGNLTVRLETATGALIEQGYLSATSFPLTSPGSHVWATYKFSSTHTLVSGQTYHLVLQAPSSSQYAAYPMQKGTAYGFDKYSYFPDGCAQFNPGTGWVGWSAWGATNRTDGDLQFFFGLAQ